MESPGEGTQNSPLLSSPLISSPELCFFFPICLIFFCLDLVLRRLEKSSRDSCYSLGCVGVFVAVRWDRYKCPSLPGPPNSRRCARGRGISNFCHGYDLQLYKARIPWVTQKLDIIFLSLWLELEDDCPPTLIDHKVLFVCDNQHQMSCWSSIIGSILNGIFMGRQGLLVSSDY